MDIIEKNGATLNSCVIDQSDPNNPYQSTKIQIKDSKNTTINFSQVYASSDTFSGIRIENSDVALNNVTLSASNTNNTLGNQIGIEATNATININGGRYKTETDQNTSEAFRLNNSTLNIKNTTISLDGEAATGFSLENNSAANLENVTITATNGAEAAFYDAENNNTLSAINITNSTLASD
ncbi:hypothetical protein BKL51_10490 [Rodentibacter sp. Ppn85]|nr:hypothetical protein BKL51_10490 [Rodentibacter sp. Ppn85]